MYYEAVCLEMAKPEKGVVMASMLLFCLGWEILKSMIHFNFNCVDGEIWYGNELFIGKFQMTDAKTWGNVVGTEMQVISAEILMIFVQGEIPY